MTAFYFSIPLAPKTDERSWRRASALLADTLASLRQQTDENWQALIAGHDRPDIPALSDPRVTFIEVDTPRPSGYEGGLGDKTAKRQATLEAIRRAGGGYVMMLDADDLMHRELVAYARKDQHPHGYSIERGYFEHYLTGSLRPLPRRANTVPFHRVCGSCVILHLSPDDIGLPGRAIPSYVDRLGPAHVHWVAISAALDRPLAPVPFPAGAYRFNTNAQLSVSRMGQFRYLLAALATEFERLPNSREIRRDFLPPR